MANILIVDDDPQILLLLEQLSESLGHQPVTAGGLQQGLSLALKGDFDLVLLDLDFPEGNGLEILPHLLKRPAAPEVIIITGTGDTRGAEIAFTYGAWDYVRKPFLLTDVSLPVVRALQYRAEKAAANRPRLLDRSGIIGDSQEISRVLEDTARAAATDSSVLLSGETGTGKELFARAIHRNSTRAAGGFVVIDCGALPETLVESILFGHEKGAFTGAVEKREGLVQQAHGGTLFMDEIGELPLSVQKALLRVLQEHRVRSLGGKGEENVDFRLVAATNRDLDDMVREETFRADLLFRIRGIEIVVPPLRDRIGDLRDIASNKVLQLGRLYGADVKGISTAFFEVLEKYSWPGNIRELINVLEHSLANAGADPTLFPIHLPPKYRAMLVARQEEERSAKEQPWQWEKLVSSPEEFAKLGDFRFAMDAKYCRSLKMVSQGDWRRACELSGLSKTRLYDLLKKHDISLSG